MNNFNKFSLEKNENVKLQQISLTKLSKPDFKIRSMIEPDSIVNLRNNIKEVGLLNPIIVRKTVDEMYEIICGVKRTLAMQQLGFDQVDAMVFENIDDKEALLLSLSDNLNHENLNVFDQTYSLLHLMSLHLNISENEVKALLKRVDNYDKGTVKEISQDDQEKEKVILGLLAKFGRIKLTTFIERTRVLNVNDYLINAIRTNNLKYTFALEINKVTDEEKMKELVSEVLDKHITRKELKDKVTEITGVKPMVNPFQNISRHYKHYYELSEDVRSRVEEMVILLESIFVL